jgi:PPOX class probable F420-dependent enzyme
MQTMSDAEYRAFLLDTVRTGKLATVRADGRPHVAPIWFDLDGEDWVFMTWHESVKGQNLQRDSRVSICVDDEQPPFSFVIIEGTAQVVEATAEERVYWAGRIGGRYMGADQAEAYGQRNGVEGELIIRVTPTKIIAQMNVSD